MKVKQYSTLLAPHPWVGVISKLFPDISLMISRLLFDISVMISRRSLISVWWYLHSYLISVWWYLEGSLISVWWYLHSYLISVWWYLHSYLISVMICRPLPDISVKVRQYMTLSAPPPWVGVISTWNRTFLENTAELPDRRYSARNEVAETTLWLRSAVYKGHQQFDHRCINSHTTGSTSRSLAYGIIHSL